MPKDFTDCIKNGGRVVTKKLKDGKYIKICYDKEGKAHSGEIHKKEKSDTQKVEDAKEVLRRLLELKEHINSNYHL